ncbi:WD repeat-containing protein 19 [Neocloeon triangulifer]|uniref:WD repeat-containing protein 19 n=1 Tax=Neocloeon triangulifer TaxID=2078957 RepID=UPI00286F7A3D|nr:WD repeat-containing protein 19 [Neocloeon triangulifer]
MDTRVQEALLTLPGSPSALVAWQKSMVAVAHQQQVFLWDRRGRQVDLIQLSGNCNGLCWDSEGDLLAASCEKSARVVLWDAQTRRPQPIVSGLGEGVSWVGWGPRAVLALATTKGNLVLYDHRSGRRMPVLGKHNRQIVSGAWSRAGLLALAAEDRSLSVSTADGDTLRAVALRAEPSLLRFGRIKTEDKPHGDDTVSVVVGRKTLYLLRVSEGDEPVELAFQPRYGQVVSYEWFGDGYILLGFSAGFLVAVSTHPKEIGHELFQLQPHPSGLKHVAVAADADLAATAGTDGQVKLHSLASGETKRVLAAPGVATLAWSADGQLLTAACSAGVAIFLARLPAVAAADSIRAAVLTSLSEVSVTEPNFQEPLTSVRLAIEPSWAAVGPAHVAAGMNNRAWFHRLGVPVEEAGTKEYVACVSAFKLSSRVAAALCEGRIHVHTIEEASAEAVVPEDESDGRVSSHDLTNEALVYGTDMGTLAIFHLQQWRQVQRFRHSCAIKVVASEPTGSRVAFLDDQHQVFVFCPFTESLIAVSVSTSTEGLLWDSWSGEASFLATYDAQQASGHVLVRNSVRGPYAETVSTPTQLPSGQQPLWLAGGELGLNGQDGRLTRVMLEGHAAVLRPDDAFDAMLALRRFKEAWSAATEKSQWKRLAEAALHDMDFEVASRAYRRLKDAGMVCSIEAASEAEDRFEAAGMAAISLGLYDLAEQAFLRSDRPTAALEMRSSLLQWPRALELATSLAQNQVPLLAKQFAQQLEFTGEHAQALAQYERASTQVDCRAGLARCSLRCGDVRRGLALLDEEPAAPIDLLRECATILEAGRHLPEAAALAERAGLFERAAELHVRLKNWPKVAQLLPRVSAPRVHAQFARAKEADGRFSEAVAAYVTAGDPEAAVRLLLDKLRRPEEAVKIVKETRNPEAAKQVARFLRSAGDATSALQLLVWCGCASDAFEFARQAGEMALLGRLLASEVAIDGAPPQAQLIEVARYFEAEQDAFLAGKFLHLAGESQRAVQLLLKAAAVGHKEALEVAVEAAAAAEHEPHLADQVIQFICGDLDGVPKDFSLVLKLYLAKGQLEEAAQVAVLMAEEEQKAGNYRAAHDTLLAAHQQLRVRGGNPPEALRSRLALLHSYTLARLHVRRGKHMLAARLLSRVAANISKFPAHAVPILTSAVIECSRAGLASTSFRLASMLMRPLHRPHLDPKYKRKIESVVRKGVRDPEAPEPTSPCPHCLQPLPEFELACSRCKNNLPFCIATGKHVIRDNFTLCPHCEFPAIASELTELLETESVCPMCGTEVEIAALSTLEDLSEHLKV